MGTIIGWLALPLGYIMEWCYRLIGNYGVAIIAFTLLTKVILLPVSVWVQKNSIKMVEMQPSLNRIKIQFFGDPDTIAEEQAKLFKAKKYNPLASLIPLAIQLILLMGVVGVIYNPFDYLFHLPADLIQAINAIASGLTGTPVDSSSIQLAAVEALKNPEYAGAFAGLQGQFPAMDISGILESIRNFHLNFLGIILSWTPSIVLGIALFVPLIAGLSSWLLCVAQNASNVLQAEQSKLNQYGMMVLSVGLSLYLGFFVPAGIALYWVASNLFAILQLYALNAVIPPKKYVDYKELEATRRELQSLENIGGKRNIFQKDEYARREKADYKRFFSIANKHLVFYSERSGFYKYYEAIIQYLLKKTNVVIHYITHDPDDAIFALAQRQPRIRPYYIGVKKLITLMMKMDADIVIMTTPDLENYYIKRSLVRKDIEYIYVPHDAYSTHIGFHEHAFDHFDTVFCVGPHAVKELRAMESLYGTKPKTLVEFGYPLLEKLAAAYQDRPKKNRSKKQILIAPSWQEDNLLDSCIDQLIEALYTKEHHLIVRPHPEYIKRYRPKLEALTAKYRDKVGECLTFELDFSSNSSIYESDLLITDWSGISLEFSFATLQPCLFINTKRKIENPNYEKVGIVPQEIQLRSQLGIALEKSELDKIEETVRILMGSQEYADRIRDIRDQYFYHFNSHGQKGGEYLIHRLIKSS